MNRRSSILHPSILHRKAGVFEAPPAIVRAVSEVVMEAWVSRILFGINAQRKSENRESFTSDLLVLENRLSREYPGVRPKRVPSKGSETVQLPYDLSGWKYKARFDQIASQLTGSERRILLRFDLGDFFVSIIFGTREIRGDWGAGWLKVWCDPDVRNYEDFVERRKAYLRTIRHETQHLGQSVLSSVILRLYNSKKNVWEPPAGVPSGNIREKDRDPSGYLRTERREDKNKIEHSRRDIEFYTRLQDEIDKAYDVWRVIPRRYRSWAFARIVGIAQVPQYRHPYESEEKLRAEREHIKKRYRFTEDDLRNLRKLRGKVPASHFFMALKRGNKAKWRKAVAEFAKAVR